MKNEYDNLLERVRKLNDNNLSIDTINEIKSIYYEFKNLNNRNIALKKNMVNINMLTSFFETVLFNVVLYNKLIIKSPNLSDEIVREMIYKIKDCRMNITNILLIDNYAFIQGFKIDDFSSSIISIPVDDSLIDIKDDQFINYLNNEHSFTNLLNLMERITRSINHVFNVIGTINEDNKNVLFIDNNKIYCNYPNLHIYINMPLAKINSMIEKYNNVNVDIIIEENNEIFNVIEMSINENTIDMNVKNDNIWHLEGNKKEKVYKKI